MKKKPTRSFWNKKLYKFLLAMKISFVLILLSTLQISASVYSQNTKMDMNLNSQTLIEVFQEVRAASEFTFVYDIEDVEGIKNLDVNVTDATVEEILDECLTSTTLTYEIVDKVVIVKQKPYMAKPAQQEKKSITGQVTDEDGVPLPGVSVVVKGFHIGVATDIDGYYTLEIADKSSVLYFSFVGMTPQEIAFTGQSEINVRLKRDSENLNEVIVTGYQKVSVERSTGSVVTVTAEDVAKKGQSNLMNTLEGMVAGLGVMSDPDNEGKKKFNIRGVSTINGDSNPLIVIDGFITDTDISQINPHDIASVTVLKDAGAASIYGSRASNGVIVITTKRGKKGNAKVSYTNSFTFNQRPDVGYRLNRLSGSDLVDAHIDGANADSYIYSYQRYLDEGIFFFKQFYAGATNTVYHTMKRLEDGYITQAQADAIINPLRSNDNTSQIQEYFTQRPYEEQHNLNLSGGSDKSVYRASLNYTKNKSSFVGDKTERIIFDIQNSIKFGEKIKLDLTGNFRLNTNKSIPYDRNIVLNHISAYQMLADADGNPLPTVVGSIAGFSTTNGGLYGGKDPIEIQRLIDLGLYDETYYPLNELKNYSNTNKGFNTRVQAMLYADLAKGLKGTFGLKYEGSASKNTKISKEESWEMKSLVNNMSPRDYTGDESTLNIPKGARIVENRDDSFSYTLRAQLDYDLSIKKHTIRTLAGTEVRHINRTSKISDDLGFDEKSLTTRFIDKDSYSTKQFEDVNHPLYAVRGFRFADEKPYFEKTDRFFSMYGNFSYDYDQRYVLSGSARIDQSNLFGTDPEYRYKPFWSLGGKWNIDKESFFESKFINRLTFRSSYGVNGNIANDYGPFTIATNGVNLFTKKDYLEISTPAVSDLRWERTSTLNFGTDITMLNRRVRLGVDYYVKNTDDVLDNASINSTNGRTSIMKNNAKIRNKGLEVSLSTTNIKTKDFAWTTSLMVRQNSNRVLSVLNEQTNVAYIVDDVQNIEGQPVNSFYLFKWAGLDNQGRATILNRNNTTITPTDYIGRDFIREDLVFAGSIEPKVTGSFTNGLAYKNFNLSFMFVFSYGHKTLKDVYGGAFINGAPGNVHSDYASAWSKPGDEAFTDIPPSSLRKAEDTYYHRYSTKSVIDAGYIRLRELIFSYNLPENALNFLSIQSASVNLRANNLLLIANNKEGIDPEAHGIGQRYFKIDPSFSFGINVNF